MKVIAAFLLLAASASGRQAAAPNPVTRVVELLEGVAKEAEKEGKAEQELYESFVCWGKSVVDQKTATNAAARAKIEELETYIADIDAGRIEFTTEREDLTKELASINADIESATSLREKEHEEFLVAEDELVKAIAALDKAIEVLAEATEGHEEGVLLQARAQAAEGFSARAKDAQALEQAVTLGSKMLSKADAFFLKRLLTGDVPTWDWKKLNRKATFKMAYKARSFKIQEVLQKMQATFTTSLADARAKEKEAQALYDELMKAKTAQKKATEEALEKMEVEMGARGKSKEESQAEIDALTEQVKNDEKFIKQTEAQLAEKKEEWKDRQELRAAEASAIAKAIEILHNDDARDLMKKSFHSQGYLLLQEGSLVSRNSAASVLRQTAKKSGDARLAVVALRLARLGSGSHFTAVIKAIDDMIAMLKEEENSDLKKKEACEANRAEDTGVAIDLSRAMDESTELIAKLTAEIAEITAEIEAKQATIREIEEQLTEATRMREDENAEWKTNDKDDSDAATTVQAARDVLYDFYTSNNLMFVQKAKKAPVVVAGEAPPPPPSTWDAPYGGKTEQSSGIIAILEMIKEDIEDDQKKAKAAEDEAQAKFDTFKAESEAQIQALNEDIAALTTSKSEKEESIAQETEMRANTKAELASRMGMIKDAEPGCDYITITYPRKLSNRQIEIDGLRKAKAILQGAKFDEVDPNRELKPGDAAAASALQLRKIGRH